MDIKRFLPDPILQQARKFRPALRIIHAAAKREYCWSHTVHDYYPITPKARWHAGTLPYQRLTKVIETHREAYEAFLDALEGNKTLLHRVGHEPSGNAPHWANGWFDALDAAALVTFLSMKQPKRYIEIGSGYSTRFARYTIDALRLPTQITSIDPVPRREIDQLCTRTIRSGLENCDLSVFDDLEPGDILFYDGSHRAFSNSDVVVFFFEVLPRLKPGVIVHIHDIFLPGDYPAEWNKRLYNEQYILAGMLLCNPPFRVLAPIAYIGADHAMGDRVKRVFENHVPFTYLDSTEGPGASFWIETI